MRPLEELAVQAVISELVSAVFSLLRENRGKFAEL
jgi:hypothetical protein